MKYIQKVHVFMYKFKNKKVTELFSYMFTTNNQIHTFSKFGSSNLHTPIEKIEVVNRTERYLGVKT